VKHYKNFKNNFGVRFLWGGQSWPKPPFRRLEPAESRLRAELPAPQAIQLLETLFFGLSGAMAVLVVPDLERVAIEDAKPREADRQSARGFIYKKIYLGAGGGGCGAGG
jgi:hypothetical protein